VDAGQRHRDHGDPAGLAGNGTFGGTVRVAKIFDKTPNMRNHSAAMHIWGNLVGTVDIEAYESYADFAVGTGANTAGAIAPVISPSAGTNSTGSASTPAKTTITEAATNAGLCVEVKMASYMR
jgi:alkaline phosphatase